MDLLQQFDLFVKSRQLLTADGAVLVAISGGVDSVVLAHLMQESGRQVALAHCNFQLRGAESDADEAFVRDLALRLELPFFVKHFDTRAFAQENGLSVQMAARQLRYSWFEEIRRENTFTAIATAHHLNDTVETTLLNLARGTGLNGLTGIPVRNGYVVRPLLFAQRDAIEIYARAQGLAWREDSSNASDDYTRNYIRRHLIPLFQELNPGFLNTAARMMQRLQDLSDNLQPLLEPLRMPEPKGQIRLEKKRLAAFPAPSALLYDLLRPYGFTEEQARQAAESQEHIGLELHADSGYRLLVDREALIVCPAETTFAPLRIEADDLLLRLPDGSRLGLIPAAPAPPFPDGLETILVDAAKLQFPLLLRPWQSGDVFQPLGMKGQHQKLQDFLVNQKIPRFDKSRIWLLLNGDGTAIWVLGLRPDERFKITEATTKALKINWIKGY